MSVEHGPVKLQSVGWKQGRTRISVIVPNKHLLCESDSAFMTLNQDGKTGNGACDNEVEEKKQ